MTRFIHIPKTGGTALCKALTGTRQVSDHAITLGNLADGDTAYTILRDPVERFISSFWWDGHLLPWPDPEAMALDLPRTLDNAPIFRRQSAWLDGDLSRLVWVGRTETLDEDFPRLLDVLGITPRALPERGDPDRNEGPPHTALSRQAIDNLRDCYADDYSLLERLR